MLLNTFKLNIFADCYFIHKILILLNASIDQSEQPHNKSRCMGFMGFSCARTFQNILGL